MKFAVVLIYLFISCSLFAQNHSFYENSKNKLQDRIATCLDATELYKNRIHSVSAVSKKLTNTQLDQSLNALVILKSYMLKLCEN